MELVLFFFLNSKLISLSNLTFFLVINEKKNPYNKKWTRIFQEINKKIT